MTSISKVQRNVFVVRERIAEHFKEALAVGDVQVGEFEDNVVVVVPDNADFVKAVEEAVRLRKT